jgi:DNA-binding NtrC family response regulator
LLERGYFNTRRKPAEVGTTARLLFISMAKLETLMTEKRICPEFAARLKGHEIELPPLRTERDLILDALWRHGFYRSNTARFLGISRTTPHLPTYRSWGRSMLRQLAEIAMLLGPTAAHLVQRPQECGTVSGDRRDI